MITGIGADLCAIDRIAKAMERDRFIQRVFTPAERARLEGLCPERIRERAAGMFAAKEAVAKALGTGFSGFGFADVEILSDAQGRPVVCLHNGAAALANGANLLLSISHDNGMALAFAVAEAEEALS